MSRNGANSAIRPVYIFGYGSLMWDPGFEHANAVPARILGWHRRFSLVSTQSWGTAEQPGVCAVLHPGGSAWGRVFAVSPDQHGQALDYLDAREAAYLRRDVTLVLRRGGKLERTLGITYVVNPQHERLRPDLGHEERSVFLRQGIGTKGSSLEYLRNTVAALTEDGHKDTDAHRILAMIDG